MKTATDETRQDWNDESLALGRRVLLAEISIARAIQSGCFRESTWDVVYVNYGPTTTTPYPIVTATDYRASGRRIESEFDPEVLDGVLPQIAFLRLRKLETVLPRHAKHSWILAVRRTSFRALPLTSLFVDN
jgi:hypothetical protein